MMNDNKFRYEGTTLTGYLGDREDKDIFIPNFIDDMWRYSLSNLFCENLYISDNTKIIRDNIIYNCPRLKNIYINEKTFLIDKNFNSSCPNLENIYVSEENYHYKSKDGILFTKGDEIYYIPQGKRGNLTLPEGPTRLSMDFFYNLSKVTKITLPHSLKAFTLVSNTFIPNLKEIVINENVEELNETFFKTFDNKKLKITINENNPYYKYEEGVIYNTKTKTVLYIDNDKEDIFNIPSWVKHIAPWAFINKNISGIRAGETLDVSYMINKAKGYSKYNTGLLYNMPNLKSLNFRKKNAEICSDWFYTEHDYYLDDYGIKPLDNTKFISLSSSFLPSQLSYSDKGIIKYKVLELLVNGKEREEWKTPWMSFIKEHMRRTFWGEAIMSKKSFLSFFIKEKAIKKEDVPYLISIANKNNDIESSASLLEYEKDCFDVNDFMDLKMKEMEKEIEKACEL